MNKEIAEKIAAAVKSSAQAATDILFKKLDPRIEALEKKAASLADENKQLSDSIGKFESSLDEIVNRVVSGAMEKIRIPKDGEDGKSVTVEDVTPVIQAAVKDAVAALPPAEPGKDGESVDMEALKTTIDETIKALFDAAPKPKDGESVDPETVKAMVAEAVAALPPAKDGESVDPEAVKAMVEQSVKAAFDEMPKPKDGKSVDPEEVKIMVADAVAAIPPAKDGESVDPEEVRAMLQGMVDKAMAEIVKAIPKPTDGRDAVDIEILAAIDEEKSYPRGTYATHRGGLWKAWQKTDGMNGWECIVDGVFKTVVNQVDDRNFFFIAEKASGAIVKLPFKVPSMIYKNVYVDGREYDEGDTVTWGGSVWYCNEKTTDKPGDGSQAWTLAVKRGRDSNPKVKI